MDEKAGRRRTLARLLVLHGLLYAASWVVALYAIANLNPSSEGFVNYTRFIMAVMLWLPVLGLHVGLHLYAVRWNSTNDERTAYREGYADALKQFADRAYHERPITQDEDAFVEMPRKHKRSG